MHDIAYNRRSEKILMLAIVILYTALFIVFLLRTAVSWDKISVSSGIICIQAARCFCSRHNRSDSFLCCLLSVAEYALIVMLFYGSSTNIEGIVFAVYTIDIIFIHKSWFGVPFAYLGYGIYVILWGGYSGNFGSAVISSINYCVFIAAVWSVKALLKQRDTILQLNKKILEQSSAMEDVAKLKERNHIAEEVHNTVGHKLTTAIVALEGAHLLFDKKPNEAREKLNIARRQLKEGLGDIREVVRAINSGGMTSGGQSFKTSLENLVREAEVQTGIPIGLKYDLHKKLLPLQEHVLANAVKEGITNAIKHARPGNIAASVIQSGNQVEVMIDNDGRGCATVTEGFGLKSIRENAKAIGGNMHYEYRPDGFTLFLYIPFVEEK